MVKEKIILFWKGAKKMKGTRERKMKSKWRDFGVEIDTSFARKCGCDDDKKFREWTFH